MSDNKDERIKQLEHKNELLRHRLLDAKFRFGDVVAAKEGVYPDPLNDVVDIASSARQRVENTLERVGGNNE